jgi:hypothetical protein
VGADVEDGQDVGVAEGGGGASLALEPFGSGLLPVLAGDASLSKDA